MRSYFNKIRWHFLKKKVLKILEKIKTPDYDPQKLNIEIIRTTNLRYILNSIKTGLNSGCMLFLIISGKELTDSELEVMAELFNTFGINFILSDKKNLYRIYENSVKKISEYDNIKLRSFFIKSFNVNFILFEDSISPAQIMNLKINKTDFIFFDNRISAVTMKLFADSLFCFCTNGNEIVSPHMISNNQDTNMIYKSILSFDYTMLNSVKRNYIMCDEQIISEIEKNLNT